MARPTKYNQGVASRICDGLKRGLTRQACCALGGITDETFSNWLKRNLDFLDLVTQAEAEAERVFTESIYNAANEGDWKAGLEWLKRRRRDEYGDNVAIRADKEAARLLAELFPEDAGRSFSPTENGTGEAEEILSES